MTLYARFRRILPVYRFIHGLGGLALLAIAGSNAHAGPAELEKLLRVLSDTEKLNLLGPACRANVDTSLEDGTVRGKLGKLLEDTYDSTAYDSKPTPLRTLLAAYVRVSPTRTASLADASLYDLQMRSDDLKYRMLADYRAGNFGSSSLTFDVGFVGGGLQEQNVQNRLTLLNGRRNGNQQIRTITFERTNFVASNFAEKGDGLTLNSATRQTLEEGNTPGRGNLNALPDGELQLSDTTSGKYGTGADFANVITINRALSSQPLLFQSSVRRGIPRSRVATAAGVPDDFKKYVAATPEGPKWAVEVELTAPDGTTTPVWVQMDEYNIAVGLGDDVLPEKIVAFEEFFRLLRDGPVEKSPEEFLRNKTFPRVLSYAKGMKFLTENKFDHTVFGGLSVEVAGYGDSARTIIEQLLNRSREEAYGVTRSQSNVGPRVIYWIIGDTEIKDCVDYLLKNRNRYTLIADAIRSGKIVLIRGRVKSYSPSPANSRRTITGIDPSGKLEKIPSELKVDADGTYFLTTDVKITAFGTSPEDLLQKLVPPTNFGTRSSVKDELEPVYGQRSRRIIGFTLSTPEGPSANIYLPTLRSAAADSELSGVGANFVSNYLNAPRNVERIEQDLRDFRPRALPARDELDQLEYLVQARRQRANQLNRGNEYTLGRGKFSSGQILLAPNYRARETNSYISGRLAGLITASADQFAARYPNLADRLAGIRLNLQISQRETDGNAASAAGINTKELFLKITLVYADGNPFTAEIAANFEALIATRIQESGLVDVFAALGELERNVENVITLNDIQFGRRRLTGPTEGRLTTYASFRRVDFLIGGEAPVLPVAPTPAPKVSETVRSSTADVQSNRPARSGIFSEVFIDELEQPFPFLLNEIPRRATSVESADFPTASPELAARIKFIVDASQAANEQVVASATFRQITRNEEPGKVLELLEYFKNRNEPPNLSLDQLDIASVLAPLIRAALNQTDFEVEPIAEKIFAILPTVYRNLTVEEQSSFIALTATNVTRERDRLGLPKISTALLLPDVQRLLQKTVTPVGVPSAALTQAPLVPERARRLLELRSKANAARFSEENFLEVVRDAKPEEVLELLRYLKSADLTASLTIDKIGFAEVLGPLLARVGNGNEISVNPLARKILALLPTPFAETDPQELNAMLFDIAKIIPAIRRRTGRTEIDPTEALPILRTLVDRNTLREGKVADRRLLESWRKQLPAVDGSGLNVTLTGILKVSEFGQPELLVSFLKRLEKEGVTIVDTTETTVGTFLDRLLPINASELSQPENLGEFEEGVARFRRLAPDFEATLNAGNQVDRTLRLRTSANRVNSLRANAQLKPYDRSRLISLIEQEFDRPLKFKLLKDEQVQNWLDILKLKQGIQKTIRLRDALDLCSGGSSPQVLDFFKALIPRGYRIDSPTPAAIGRYFTLFLKDTERVDLRVPFDQAGTPLRRLIVNYEKAYGNLSENDQTALLNNVAGEINQRRLDLGFESIPNNDLRDRIRDVLYPKKN